jgi:multidrug resistance protein MdtO
MSRALATTRLTFSDPLDFLSWFWEFLREELAPYPGRGVIVARMVIAGTITMLLIMTFRIPGGALGVLYAFLISRDTLQSTFKSGVEVAISYSIGICFVLSGAHLFADNSFARFFWFAGSMFAVFLGLQVLRDYGIAIGFAIILVNVLPIWQMPESAEMRVELTLWQGLAVGIGTLVTVGVEAIFHAFHARDELFQGIDDRLAAVGELIRLFAENQAIDEELANRLARYSIVGASGLRRVIARSKYEWLYREQLSAVVNLTGRLIDLAATTARTPHTLFDSDRMRLHTLYLHIAEIRRSISAGAIPHFEEELEMEQSGIPLLPEIQRTLALLPRVFSGAASIYAYLPSVLDEEQPTWSFLRSDAFNNPAYLQFALRGCLATTICYFTYELLDWRGISTSVTTCVVTALSNVGTSRQKQLLRVAGAAVGGFVFGIGSQVLVLPNVDSIAGFTLLFAAVTAIGAWCATASQRFSYFGIQLALAFYLVHLQEFRVVTSLAIARDRVVGIMFGLSMMWLVFDRLGGASAVDQMMHAFDANLRAIAELALQPQEGSPQEAIMRIRTLRDQIGTGFQTVHAQADAVPFEIGPRWEERMEERRLIRRWQPQSQTLYLMVVALLQHRVFEADADLPAGFRKTQRSFNEAFSLVLKHLADRSERSQLLGLENLDKSLDAMRASAKTQFFTEAASAKARGMTELSRQIRDEVTELARERSETRLSRAL